MPESATPAAPWP